MNQSPTDDTSPKFWEKADRPVEATWAIELSSSPTAIWPLLADTSNLNERLGLPQMVFEERDGQLHGTSGRGLLRQEWVELPWAWEAAKWLTAERRYTRGPALAVRVRYHLDGYQGGTRLKVRISWIPRAWWSRPVLGSINRWLRKQYERVLPELDDLAGRPRAEALHVAPSNDATVNETRLKLAIQELTNSGISKSDVDRLANYIRTASDQQLFRIRPKQLAFKWGMELEGILGLLLQSTRAGLLRLSWDVICPHCLGVRKESRSLGDLREFGRCDVCDIDFDATTPESIEVTFRVLAEIRVVREVFYCSAEPAKKPHILVQHWLDPGDEYETEMTFSPGRYRIRRAAGTEARLSFDVGKSPGGARSLTWNADETQADSRQTIAPRASLKLTNPDKAQSTLVVVEKIAGDAAALRPSELFNLQRFRDLFSEESIATGLKLEVGHQTLLFTDMVGSTRMYRKLGDTKAFNAVHAHFVSLQKIVGSRRGAVVKTIGDAMMAAFQRPEDALAAAVEIQQRFRGDGEEPLTLRASLHRGICLAVRLESNIDYFGRAVNYAAKIESVAGAREIVMSDAFYAQPGIAEQSNTSGLELEELTFPPLGSDEDEAGTVMLASFRDSE